MTIFQVLRNCFLILAACVTVGACKGPARIGPPGAITLNYDSASNTNYFFVLENRSTQSIRLYASKTGKGIMPWNTTLICTPANPASSEAINSPPLGYSDKRDTINVLPESSIPLSIEKEDIALRFVGGHCHLELRLPDGEQIESKNFQP
jgi:hypothetical protein